MQAEAPKRFVPAGRNDYRLVEAATSPSSTATVVIPTHGDTRALGYCLRSLERQSYPRDMWDVIVVEDGCDGALHSLGRDWKFRVRAHPLGPGSGRRSAARNAGILNATGQIIVSLDADVVLPTRGLEAHLRWFGAGQRVATIGLRRFINAPNAEVDIERLWHLPDVVSASNLGGLKHDKRLPEISRLYSHPFPSNLFHGCNVAYSRDDALNVGLWSEEFDGNYGYEDLDFGHRLWMSGCFLIYESEATALHLEGEDLTVEDRRYQAQVNREKLYTRHPELGRYRQSRD